MQQPEHQSSIAQDTHIRYVFHQLSPEEEAQFEDFLDANPHEADILEGIQLFCENRGIRTREAFDQAWYKEMEGVKDKLAPNKTSLPNAPSIPNLWKWLVFGLCFLFIGGVFWLLRERNLENQYLKEEKHKVLQRDSAINSLQIEIKTLKTNLKGLSAPSNSPRDTALQIEIKQLKEVLIRKEAMLLQMQSNIRPKNREIAMKYAPPKKQTRSSQSSAPGNVFEAADRAYDSGNYEESIRLLQSIPKQESYGRVLQRLPYVFFYGKRYREASEYFVELAESNQSTIMEIQYYLLLCNLAEGRKLEARLMRATILSNRKHPYYKETNAIPEIIFKP
jgi:hypothetical protein